MRYINLRFTYLLTYVPVAVYHFLVLGEQKHDLLGSLCDCGTTGGRTGNL